MTEKKDDRTLYQRLATALGNMPNPPKNAEAKVPTKNGGSYTYSYATLDAVLDVVKPALKAEGLAMLQRVNNITADGLTWAVETGVTDGAEVLWMDRRPFYPNADPQKMGAAETYTRRYSITTAFGLAAVEDTDAQGAASEPSPLEAARYSLIEACHEYAAATGKDAKTVMDGVAHREGFSATVEGFKAATEYVAGLLRQVQ